jgi:prepilin-type N-terminal cleavage/methylation domain-containing protein
MERSGDIMNRKGVSLVEMMVVIAIFTILGSGLMTTMLVAKNSRLRSDAKVQLRQSLRQVLDRTKNDLRHATSLTITQGPPDILKLTRVELCESGCDGWSVQFEIDANNQLIRKLIDDGDNEVSQQVIAPYISNFDISAPVVDADDRIVSIVITATSEKRLGGDAVHANNPLVADTMKQRIAFRNEFFQP